MLYQQCRRCYVHHLRAEVYLQQKPPLSPTTAVRPRAVRPRAPRNHPPTISTIPSPQVIQNSGDRW